MREFDLVAPCHFGLEAVLKREITDLGFPITHVEDGRVTFKGDASAVCKANIHLRTAERILLQTGQFTAVNFEELFQATKAIPWEEYLPRDARIWVAKATSIKSRLFSSSDIQSIMKKAIVERLKTAWGTDVIPETGEAYPLRVFAMKDVFTVGLDTTGSDSLHKRGYRKSTTKAPISETLAAALILLTPWKDDRILVDPFCGSGTFCIEAALMAAGIAPGAYRRFQAQNWENLIPKHCFTEAFAEARAAEHREVKTNIFGYDIDPESLRMARENAERAGIGHLVTFSQRDVADFAAEGSFGFIITNPPYGERLEEKEALPALYRALGKGFAGRDRWSMYVITSFDQTENCIGRKADKNRKIYNGMIQTYYYQFIGPKPQKGERPAVPETEQPVLPKEEGSAAPETERPVLPKEKRPALPGRKAAGEKKEPPKKGFSLSGGTIAGSNGRRLVIKDMEALKKRLERPDRQEKKH